MCALVAARPARCSKRLLQPSCASAQLSRRHGVTASFCTPGPEGQRRSQRVARSLVEGPIAGLRLVITLRGSEILRMGLEEVGANQIDPRDDGDRSRGGRGGATLGAPRPCTGGSRSATHFLIRGKIYRGGHRVFWPCSLPTQPLGDWLEPPWALEGRDLRPQGGCKGLGRPSPPPEGCGKVGRGRLPGAQHLNRQPALRRGPRCRLHLAGQAGT